MIELYYPMIQFLINIYIYILKTESFEIQRGFVGLFNKTIIPLALVGYEMLITKRALHALLAIFDLISKWHSWNIVNY